MNELSGAMYWLGKVIASSPISDETSIRVAAPPPVPRTDQCGTTLNGDASDDILSGFENTLASSHNDILIGDGNDNVLEGGAGNDTISAGAAPTPPSYAHATAAVTVNLGLTTAQ